MLTEPKKVKKGVALAGVNAGTTAVCTVGHSGNDLHYRGYDILELAKECSDILLPGRLSIARALIEDWFGGEIVSASELKG